MGRIYDKDVGYTQVICNREQKAWMCDKNIEIECLYRLSETHLNKKGYHSILREGD